MPNDIVHPPNATPLPKESLVPGRLELTVKFSELPRPRSVQDGFKMGIQTGEGIVTAILPAKVWRTLERATQTYPQWVAALSGSLDRFAAGEIALKHPAVQVFEKKAKPAVAPEEGRRRKPNGPRKIKALEGPNPSKADQKALEGRLRVKSGPEKAPDGQAAKLPVAAETPKGAAAPPAARPSPTHLRATISLKGRAAPQ